MQCKDISSILTIWLSSILLSFFLSIPVLPSLIYSPHRLVKVFDLGLFPVLRLCEPHHLFLAVWLAEREFKKLNLTKIIFQQFDLLVLRTLGRYNHLTGELALQVLWKSQIGLLSLYVLWVMSYFISLPVYCHECSKIIGACLIVIRMTQIHLVGIII